MRCPNCGSSAQFKEHGKEEGPEHMIQVFTCGCGYRHQVIWKKDMEVGRINGTIIHRKKF